MKTTTLSSLPRDVIEKIGAHAASVHDIRGFLDAHPEFARAAAGGRERHKFYLGDDFVRELHRRRTDRCNVLADKVHALLRRMPRCRRLTLDVILIGGEDDGVEKALLFENFRVGVATIVAEVPTCRIFFPIVFRGKSGTAFEGCLAALHESERFAREGSAACELHAAYSMGVEGQDVRGVMRVLDDEYTRARISSLHLYEFATTAENADDIRHVISRPAVARIDALRCPLHFMAPPTPTPVASSCGLHVELAYKFVHDELWTYAMANASRLIVRDALLTFLPSSSLYRVFADGRARWPRLDSFEFDCYVPYARLLIERPRFEDFANFVVGPSGSRRLTLVFRDEALLYPSIVVFAIAVYEKVLLLRGTPSARDGEDGGYDDSPLFVFAYASIQTRCIAGIIAARLARLRPDCASRARFCRSCGEDDPPFETTACFLKAKEDDAKATAGARGSHNPPSERAEASYQRDLFSWLHNRRGPHAIVPWTWA